MTKTVAEKKYNFISEKDGLAVLINEKANKLFYLLRNFDSSKLDTEPFFKNYFADHHLGKRLVFSIENSAHILYHAIKKCNKPVDEISMADYGAGLGTLFMLGSLLGVKRFIYNDHLAEWKNNAKLICSTLGIPVTEYIVGDISAVLQYATDNHFTYDIIASRNVIEHIYSLPDFFGSIHRHNADCIIYSTTTASYHNPAMHLIHILHHKKIEKNHYRAQREAFIKKKYNNFSDEQLNTLVQLTRGMWKNDIDKAIDNFLQNNAIKPDRYLYTNTCDLETGVWAEHLLSKKAYKEILATAGFKMEYSGGFWDTHYSSVFKNIFTQFFNKMIRIAGKKGYVLSTFINVVAYN